MKKEQQFTWLLFDADNTLFDFYAAEAASLANSLEYFGVPSSSDHLQLYKRINKECWLSYEDGHLTKAQLRLERFRRFFSAIQLYADAAEFERTYLGNLQNGTQMLPNAEEILSELKPKYRLGLITNGFKEVQRPRLEKSKIDRFFEVIIISDEIGVAKPHKGFFDYAFSAMKHDVPSSALVIGDSINADIKGGQQYGTATCWMNPEGQKPPEGINPDYQIKNLLGLRNLL